MHAAACFDLDHNWQQLSSKLGRMPRKERSLAVSLMRRVLHKMEVRIHASRGLPPDLWGSESSSRHAITADVNREYPIVSVLQQVPIAGAAATAAAACGRPLVAGQCHDAGACPTSCLLYTSDAADE